MKQGLRYARPICVVLRGRPQVGLSVFALILIFSLSFSLFAQSPPPASFSQKTTGEARQGLAAAYGKLPLTFEANRGQTDRQVRFLSRGSGYTLFLTSGEAVLSLRRPPSIPPEKHSPQRTQRTQRGNEGDSSNGVKAGLPGIDGAGVNSRATSAKPGCAGLIESASADFANIAREFIPALPDSATIDVLRLRLLGANPDPAVSGLDAQPGVSHYLIGNDPAKWRTDVLHYGRVHYRNIYPGIDLVYYGTDQRRLEYDFVVSPGADPGRIRLSFDGADSPRLDDQGNLVLHTRGGEVVLQAPVAYQEIGGVRRLVESRFMLGPSPPLVPPVNGGKSAMALPVHGEGRGGGRSPSPLGRGGRGVRFVLGPYDPSQPLIIDPVLTYSTYLGGSGDDYGQGIAVDGSGNAYIVGYTTSSDFPTAGPYQASYGGGSFDAFVTKLNASGSALTYSTYLGGSGIDQGIDIAVDGSGNAYVVGNTFSTNFPTASPYQASNGGTGDVFVAKLNASGSALTYSTYLGGSGTDGGRSIALDGSGNVYLTGSTTSSDFPTASALDASLGGTSDAFVTKLNASGSALTYSTYLGGSGSEGGQGIAVDGSGNAYVTGNTTSSDFPTASALDASLGGTRDVFVTKLNASGSALTYSTYLGGSGDDYGQGIALDGSGNAHIVGYTTSSDFPTANALDTSLGGGADAIVMKLNASGSALTYSTYLGGSGSELGYGIALDGSGNAYVTGQTASSDFPTANALDTSLGGTSDAFVTKLNASGSALAYSSYLGGSGSESGNAVVVDGSDKVYVTGYTQSSNFPTASYDATLSGSQDVFVTRMDLDATPPSAPTGLSATAGNNQVTLNWTANGESDLSYYVVYRSTTNNFTPTSSDSIARVNKPTVTYTNTGLSAGTYYFKIAAEDSANNRSSASSQASATLSPGISLSSSSVSVGTVNVGSSGQQTFTVSNVGTAALTISSVTVSGTHAAQFSVSPTSFTVNAGASAQTVTVTFTPAGSTGSRSASLSIAHNATGSPSSVTLSGTAQDVTAPSAPTGLSATAGNNQVSLSWTANGESDLSYYVVYRSTTNNFTPTSSDSIARVNKPTVTYTNTGLSAGTYYFKIAAEDSSGNRSSASSQASATLSPGISLSSTSLAFGSVTVGGTPGQQTFTVSNVGTAALTISSIAVSGTDAGQFSVSPTSFTVNAGASAQTVTVTFTPAGSTGSRSASLSIAHNATGSPSSVALSGTAQDVGIPSVPTGLSATAGNNQVSLSWTSNSESDLSHYVIYRSATNNFTPTSSDSIARVNKPTVTYTNTGLSAGTYYFKIAAGDSSGNRSSASSQASATLTPGISLSSSSVSVGTVNVGSSGQQTFTVSNVGTAALTISSVTVSGTDAAQFSVSPTSFTVNAGASAQTVTVTFTPAGSTGSRSASLSISHNATGSPSSVTLSGTAQDVTAPAAPTGLSATAGNSQVTLNWTSNTESDLSHYVIYRSTTNNFTPTSSDSIARVNKPTVTYTNTGLSAGTYYFKIAAEDSSGNRSSASAQASATLAPGISLSSTSLAFGSVTVGGTPGQQTFTVSNTGTDTLRVSSMARTGADSAQFSVSPASLTIPPGSAAQTVTVTFAPTGGPGGRSATLSLAHNAAGSPSSVTLSGTALAPVVSLPASTLSFGDVAAGRTVSLDLSVKNTGTANLTITGLTLAGNDPGEFQVAQKASVVASGDSVRVAVVSFVPTSSGGSKSAYLSVAHNATGSPSQVYLTGVIPPPRAQALVTSLNFGEVEVGKGKALEWTIVNAGGSLLSVRSIASDNPRFSVSESAFDLSVGAGGRDVRVTFSPTAEGPQAGTLTVASNDPVNSVIRVSVAGTGIVIRPRLKVSAERLDFGGVVVGRQKALVLTVSNAGRATLIVQKAQVDHAWFMVSPDSLALDPGVSRDLTVTFAPASTDSVSAALTLISNDPDTPERQVPLTGRGRIEAGFRADSISGRAPLRVAFTDSSRGPVTGWAWQFGDGETSSIRNPSHVYQMPGVYAVSLTVTGPGGAVDSVTKAGLVRVPPRPGFTASPTAGVDTLTVRFTDATRGQVTSRRWAFGDGDTSSAQDPAHFYRAPGFYAVSLTATGPGGADTQERVGLVRVIRGTSPALTVSVLDTAAEVGQAGAVAFVGVDSARGVAGGDFALRYDAGVLTVRGVAASALATGAGMTLASNADAPGRVAVSLAGATAFSSGGGPLWGVTFDVNAGAAPGAYDLTLEATLKDEDGRDVPVAARRGVLTVRPKAPTVSVSDATVDVGQSGVPISVGVDNARGIAGGDFALRYDAGVLTARGVAASALTTGAGMALVSNVRTPGEVRVSVAGAAAIPSGDGPLWTATFDVSASAAPGAYDLAVEAGLTDEDGREVRVATRKGVLTVRRALSQTGQARPASPDFNGDGRVDIDDLFMLTEAFGRPATGANAVCDLNRNGRIDIDDFFMFTGEFGKTKGSE